MLNAYNHLELGWAISNLIHCSMKLSIQNRPNRRFDKNSLSLLFNKLHSLDQQLNTVRFKCTNNSQKSQFEIDQEILNRIIELILIECCYCQIVLLLQ